MSVEALHKRADTRFQPSTSTKSRILIVASVTLSIGMVQLPPVMLSAPFKILLFVLVDGWNLVVGSLMKSFY